MKELDLVERVAELEAENEDHSTEHERMVAANAELVRLNLEARSKWADAVAKVGELEALLVRAYHSGHREGWEDGETKDEVMADLHCYFENNGIDYLDSEGE